MQQSYAFWHEDGIDPKTLEGNLERRNIVFEEIRPSPASDKTVLVYTKTPIPKTEREDLQRRYRIS